MVCILSYFHEIYPKTVKSNCFFVFFHGFFLASDYASTNLRNHLSQAQLAKAFGKRIEINLV